MPLEQVDVSDASAEAAIHEQLAQAHDLSAYDAAYLELALRFKVLLRTSVRALRKAAEVCGVEIA